jgi:N-methylhydantoinase B/oxoprolinase/acetone carboxylase alpha subunit
MKDQKTNQMTATVVTYPANVQQKIDELVADNYALDDIVEFIEENGNDNFVEYYEEYCENGENYSYDAVDAFVDEFGIECIAHFTDAYYGEYDSEEQFAEQFCTDCYPINLDDTPIVVDWTATWNCNLRYDFSFNGGYVFHKNY